MVIRFAYLKLIRPNQSSFSPGTAITTYLQAEDVQIAPLGDAGTAAPSTILIDRHSGNQYYLNKAFSATHAALTAVTGADSPLNII